MTCTKELLPGGGCDGIGGTTYEHEVVLDIRRHVDCLDELHSRSLALAGREQRVPGCHRAGTRRRALRIRPVLGRQARAVEHHQRHDPVPNQQLDAVHAVLDMARCGAGSGSAKLGRASHDSLVQPAEQGQDGTPPPGK